MFNRRYRIFILSLFVLLAGSRLHAQANSEITGTVADKEGAAIPDAQVTATNTATGFTSSTNTNGVGLYTLPGLNVGVYDLKVTAKGFQASLQKGVQVNVSQVLRADVTLSVGSVSETVEVAANALTVQADSNVVSSLISSEQISEIATQNRNFAALAGMTLGASSTMPDNNTPSAGAGGSSFNLSINGLRQSHNIWLIDGGESDDRGGAGGMQIMPSQDAIDQFEVLASNYPPDYGISSGATISLGLKSGTKSFHGSLWEFNRNTVYDANSYFNKQSGKARSGLNYNIYGFNVGGPVTIPGVYNKDRSKTFFFWNEEWRKITQSPNPNNNPTLPAADFPVAGKDLTYVAPGHAPNSKILVPSTVTDPAKVGPNGTWTQLGLIPGHPFPNNTIPAAIIDPNAIAYLNAGFVPKPNAANDRAVTTAPTPLTVRDDIVRVDHRINDKWQILAHYLHDSVTQAQGGPMVGWSGGSYNTITSTIVTPSNSGTLKITGSITPTLLAEASLNYDGNSIDIVNSQNSKIPSGFTAARFFNNGSTNVPDMQWNGQYGGVKEQPGSAPWHNAAQDYSPKVDVSYLYGKHSLKFGFSYNRYTKNQQLFGSAGGNYNFGTATGGSYNGVSYSGDPFMDMVLGISSSYSQFQFQPIRHYVNQTTSVYANDNWKVTPRLSLQLGLRYDALPHAWERGNNIANFDPTQYQPAAAPNYLPATLTIGGVQYATQSSQMDSTGPGFATVNGTQYYLNGIYLAGVNGAPKGLVTNDYRSLQPRIGFSEDLFGTGKTILRGGFGTFYERIQGNDIYNVATTPPFANNPSASSVYLTNPNTSWVTGQTAAKPFTAQGGFQSLSRTYPPPAVAQFSLGVQHEIAPSVVAVVQYVGNIAWHQNTFRQINYYPLSTSMNVRAWAGDSGNASGTNHFSGTTSDVLLQRANGDYYRTYRGWGNFAQQENTSNGNYNGFQVGLRARGWRGLSGELDYTWSHEIDIQSGDNGPNVSNPFNLKYDKGSGSYDRRHILNANYIYKLPFFATPGLMHSVLGGWEIAGTAVFQTGGTINAQGPNLGISYDTVGLGGGYRNRPDVVGKVHYTKTQAHWFDNTAFAAPLPAWAGSITNGFGNMRKDTVIGPGRVNFNTSLYKSFAFTERARFELRLESFNTFNHTEFNGVNSTYTGPNDSFGSINSTWDPRTLELGGKFVF